MELATVFRSDAVTVAPLLLGALLSKSTDQGTVTVRITEVEAYLGVGEDPGSHGFRKMTPRNAVMFGPPARLYTYFTYGMHVCANVVCAPEGLSSGLLLRAGRVVEGADLARERRGQGVVDRDLARGPARLAKALGITLDDGGSALDAYPFDLRLPESPVAGYRTGPRTGISGPGGSEQFPWRFWIEGDPTVSPYRRHPKSH